MTNAPTAPVSQLMLRICENLHDRLEAAAHANQRSLNAEVVARLEASFADGALLARMHRLEELTLASNATADA
jgi:hypothetical protein